MQDTHFLLGLSMGLALQDHIRNGSVKIINGFLSLPVRLDKPYSQTEQTQRQLCLVLGLSKLSSDLHACPRTASARHAYAVSFYTYKMTKFGRNFTKIA